LASVVRFSLSRPAAAGRTATVGDQAARGHRQMVRPGAFYAWVNIEETGKPAEEVQRILLEDVGVAAIAGAAFGAEGKNYVRFSLVSATHLLEAALERIERATMHWRSVASRSAGKAENSCSGDATL